MNVARTFIKKCVKPRDLKRIYKPLRSPICPTDYDLLENPVLLDKTICPTDYDLLENPVLLDKKTS